MVQIEKWLVCTWSTVNKVLKCSGGGRRSLSFEMKSRPGIYSQGGVCLPTYLKFRAMILMLLIKMLKERLFIRAIV
jgi:hypothetical protein